MRRIVFVVLGVVLAACGGGTDGLAVVANPQQTLTPGPNRILMAAATEDGGFISRPDTPTSATFADETAGEVTVDTEWVWAIPNVRRFHVAYVDLPEPCRWDVTLQPEGGQPTTATPFGVQSSSPVPDIGDPAITVATRTHPEFPLEEISSGSDPDPSLHEPSLDQLAKDVKGSYPDANWLHVEVYDNLDETNGGTLDPVEAIATWSLPSEPWVFVSDSDGVVTARFEGALSADELRRALEGLG